MLFTQHCMHYIALVTYIVKKKIPTFSVLIPEDIFIIEHTVTYSLLHKTVILHHSAGFFYYPAGYLNLYAFSSQNLCNCNTF